MFNTTTGLFESSNNTGTGISSLEVDSLVIPTGIDLALIESLGSKNIITNSERSQITTNQNAITTNSQAILAINSKIAPISYQPSPNELYVNSNVLLQDPANSSTKFDLTCDDLTCDDIQSDQITANSMITNSIESNGVNLNTAITSLETKTTNQSFSSNKTSFTGDFEVERLTINGTNINKGSGSIITTTERNSLSTISDFTKNVLSDTVLIDDNIIVGSVSTKKDITCNDIVCHSIVSNGVNLNTAITTNTQAIQAGAAAVSTNAGNISTNAGNISTNAAGISSNLQSINAINMTISAISGEVDYNSRRQLAQNSIPVYENTSQNSNIDLSSAGTGNPNFELKTQLFDIEIDNQSTQLTKNYYVPTNIGNKRIVNLQFIYREAAVGSALFRIYPPEFLKYYDNNASSSQQSRILIENIPPSFDIEGILSIEYIN